MTLETIEISTSDEPDCSIIWLHGLGADGQDFAAMVPELKLPDDLAVRFIFPHAPYRAITMNNGYVMRGWYDIMNLEFDKQEDLDGITESSHAISQLIDLEISRGINSRRILLAGFSQGGAIALHTAFRYASPLAGVMALSTYLPLHKSFKNEKNVANSSLPIFMAHGLQDSIVQYQYAVASRQLFQENNLLVEWHDYSMEHSVCLEEINDIRHWILAQLLN